MNKSVAPASHSGIFTHSAELVSSRRQKADKIIAILRDFCGSDLSNMDCLDVGCSDGLITTALAPHFGSIVGVDIDRPAIHRAVSSREASGPFFVLADGGRTAFPSNHFDVVVCAQVYEHTTDQSSLAAEIYRVLRPGGVCFFSGPNRLAIMEEHYWLPFLSWLPRPLSNLYMRLARKGPVYDIYPRFHWQIRRLWGRFEQVDYTSHLIKSPARFASTLLGNWQWVNRLPAGLINAFTIAFPNYNWIVIKPE